MSLKTFIEPKEKVIVNVVVTAVQAFVATWSATGFKVDKVTLAGAVGAALSGAWNLVLKPYLVKEGWLRG